MQQVFDSMEERWARATRIELRTLKGNLRTAPFLPRRQSTRSTSISADTCSLIRAEVTLPAARCNMLATLIGLTTAA